MQLVLNNYSVNEAFQECQGGWTAGLWAKTTNDCAGFLWWLLLFICF